MRLCWLRTRPMCRGDLKTGIRHIGIDKRPNSNCSRITGNPEVISSPVRLVPANAPAVTPTAGEKPTSHYFSGLSLTLQVLLPSVGCSFFDQSRNLLRPRDVDRVAGARDFDRVALGPLGIPTFQVRADGSIASRH